MKPFWQGFWYGISHPWVMPWSKKAKAERKAMALRISAAELNDCKPGAFKSRGNPPGGR